MSDEMQLLPADVAGAHHEINLFRHGADVGRLCRHGESQ
jgi:hypothetical protein